MNPTQPSPAPTWVVWTIIAAFCAPALYTLYRRMAYRLRRRDSSTWTLTTTITQSSTIQKIGRGGGPWEVTFLYSYRTDQYQSGEQKKVFSNEEEARDLMASVKDRQLPVRFDPQKPSVSELVLD